VDGGVKIIKNFYVKLHLEMVSKTKIKKRTKVKVLRKQSSKNMQRPPLARFGPISAISTAPVAIGNSLTGVKSQVSAISNGVRVIGRDFAFQAVGTGTISGWANAGGFPLTPAGFVSTSLRAYCQIYNKFKINKVNVHYITSSATSSTGDVMFMVTKDRIDPLPNHTASTFLAYALSDPNTVIGPQWTNHTASFTPASSWCTLDYGMNGDVSKQATGEIFLYSKTSTTDSPGYVLLDYDISFCEMSINPRAGLLPNPNIIYQPVSLAVQYPIVYTANTTVIILNSQTLYMGGTSITSLISTSTFKAGDIYKVMVDYTNSLTWTATVATPNNTNLFSQLAENTTATVNISDGFTFYIVARNTTDFYAFPSLAQALTNITTNAFRAGVTFTSVATGVNTGVNLFGQASFIGNVTANNLQQQ